MDSPASTPREGAPDDAFMSSNGLTGDLNGLGQQQQQQQQPGQTHAGGCTRLWHLSHSRTL
jgi:hypothetical protein